MNTTYTNDLINELKNNDLIRDALQHRNFQVIYADLQEFTNPSLIAEFTMFCMDELRLNPIQYLTKIPDNFALSLNDLTHLYIPECITAIGKNAFGQCFDLKQVIIGSNVLTIGEYAFSDCINLRGVTIPKGVEIIDVSAFKSCESLNRVDLPDGLRLLGTYAFSGCKELNVISIPDSIKTLGSDIFRGCPKLTSVIFRGTKLQALGLFNNYPNDTWKLGSSIEEIICDDGVINL